MKNKQDVIDKLEKFLDDNRAHYSELEGQLDNANMFYQTIVLGQQIQCIGGIITGLEVALNHIREMDD